MGISARTYPNVARLTRRQLAALGRVAVNCAAVEETARMVVGSLLKLDQGSNALLLLNRPHSAVLTLIADLAPRLIEDRPSGLAWVKWSDEARILSEERNRLLHMGWVVSETGGLTGVRAARTRKRPIPSLETRELEEIEDVADEALRLLAQSFAHYRTTPGFLA